MKGTALTFRPGVADPAVEQLAGEVPLGWIQERVDGYIEAVPHFDSIEHGGETHRCVAFCNEEGKLKEMPFNNRATVLWDRALRRNYTEDGKPLYPNGLLRPDGNPGDVLVGPIVVLFGDDEFMDEL